MANLRTARELFASASRHAESGDWLQSARDGVEAFKQARGSTARGSGAFAYRAWNAALSAALTAHILVKDRHAMKEAERLIDWLKSADHNYREPLARLRALRQDRSFEREGPHVWAAKNYEAARELEELEAELGQ